MVNDKKTYIKLFSNKIVYINNNEGIFRLHKKLLLKKELEPENNV